MKSKDSLCVRVGLQKLKKESGDPLWVAAKEAHNLRVREPGKLTDFFNTCNLALEKASASHKAAVGVWLIRHTNLACHRSTKAGKCAGVYIPKKDSTPTCDILVTQSQPDKSNRS